MQHDISTSSRQWAWIGALILSSLLFSLVFACATPFAAFAVLAASFFGKRDAMVLVIGVWLINQVVGYGLLGYPQNAESFAWGGAIGVAALVAMAGAWWADRGLSHVAEAVRWMLMLVVSFALYEVVLFATTAILSSGSEAFSWAVIGEVVLVNVLALVALLIAEKAALAVGLAMTPRRGSAATG